MQLILYLTNHPLSKKDIQLLIMLQIDNLQIYIYQCQPLIFKQQQMKKPLQTIQSERLNASLSQLARSQAQLSQKQVLHKQAAAMIIRLAEQLNNKRTNSALLQQKRISLSNQIEQQKQRLAISQRKLEQLKTGIQTLTAQEIELQNRLGSQDREKQRLQILASRTSLAGSTKTQASHKLEKGRTQKLQERLAVLEQNLRSKQKYLGVLVKENQRANQPVQIQPLPVKTSAKKRPQTPSGAKEFNAKVRQKNKKLIDLLM